MRSQRSQTGSEYLFLRNRIPSFRSGSKLTNLDSHEQIMILYSGTNLNLTKNYSFAVCQWAYNKRLIYAIRRVKVEEFQKDGQLLGL